MADPARQRLTYAEYLELEAAADVRHEWLDGEVVAMAGGTPVHAQLSAQAIVALSAVFGPRGCNVYSSDLRVRIPASGLATYPGVSVVCGEIETHDEDHNAAINPVLVVEVLSPTTERWDRGRKMTHYRQLASLKAVVLVNQDWQFIEWFEVHPTGWLYRSAGADQQARIDVLDVTLDVDAVYRRTGLPTEAPPLEVREPEPTYGAPRDRVEA